MELEKMLGGQSSERLPLSGEMRGLGDGSRSGVFDLVAERVEVCWVEGVAGRCWGVAWRVRAGSGEPEAGKVGQSPRKGRGASSEGRSHPGGEGGADSCAAVWQAGHPPPAFPEWPLGLWKRRWRCRPWHTTPAAPSPVLSPKDMFW